MFFLYCKYWTGTSLKHGTYTKGLLYALHKYTTIYSASADWYISVHCNLKLSALSISTILFSVPIEGSVIVWLISCVFFLQIKKKQEQLLKVRNFLPPQSQEPEIHLLEKLVNSAVDADKKIESANKGELKENGGKTLEKYIIIHTISSYKHHCNFSNTSVPCFEPNS